MRIKLLSITSLLGAAAAAIAISAAPIAAAATEPTADVQSCSATGGGTICQSPGNVQLNDTPPQVGFYPYGGDAFLRGGGGLFGGGGFHGGGFHGGGHR
jgi:hypothetical protein